MESWKHNMNFYFIFMQKRVLIIGHQSVHDIL